MESLFNRYRNRFPSVWDNFMIFAALLASWFDVVTVFGALIIVIYVALHFLTKYW